MAHTRRTLALTESWDLTLDGSGALALNLDAAATAQNVANECRLFTGDAYFARDSGIPYFAVALGNRLPASACRAYLGQAALRVADVAEVTGVSLDGLDRADRMLSGAVTVVTVDGKTLSTDV